MGVFAGRGLPRSWRRSKASDVGVVLISPALDIGADLADVSDPFSFAARLPHTRRPSAREREG